MKIKALKNLLKIGNWKLEITLLALLIFVFMPKAVDAALIIQAPKYIGLTNGLVGYWSFDGKDMAGAAPPHPPGKAHKRPPPNGPTRAIGKIGQGLSFDGVDDVIDAGTNITPKANGISGSAWVNMLGVADIANDDRVVMSLWTTGSTGNFNFGVGDYGLANDNRLSFTANPDDTWPNVLSTGTINLNGWQHIAFTYDGSNVRFYFNGTLDSSPVFSTSLLTTAGQRFVLGNVNLTNTDNNFQGYLDDVRVYNRALSGDEIKRLYKIGATLKINTSINNDSLTRELVGYWSFDGKDMAGVTAYDRSGNANNGTLTNGPTRAQGKIGQGLDFNAGSQKSILSTDFSSTQGSGNFYYQYFDTSYHNMTYNAADSCWTYDGNPVGAGNEYLRVCSNGVSHPGGTLGDAAVTWQAPSTQSVYYKAVLSDGDGGGGDGIVFKILNNSTELSSNTYANGFTEQTLTGSVSMTAGDQLHFRINKNANNDYDGTNLAIYVYPGGVADDYVNMGDVNALDGISHMTISAWAKPSALYPFVNVVSKSETGGGGIVILTDGSIDGCSGDSRNVIVAVAGECGYTTSNFLQAGTWGLWTMVYDGTQTGDSSRMKFYFNGVEQSLSFFGSVPATTASNAYNLRIGADSANNHISNFIGSIDDIRIYTRALSADEIKRLYKIGGTFKINTTLPSAKLSLEIPGLVGYWSFDGPDMVATSTGSAALDRSGNNKAGFLVGADGASCPGGGTKTVTTAGTFTFPTSWSGFEACVTATAEVWGGGGAGAGGTTDDSGGYSGGGGGAYAKKTSIAVSNGVTYNGKVGSAGTGSTGAGTAGGDSWFNDDGSATVCSDSGASVCAKGGKGGSGATSNGLGGEQVGNTGSIGGTINAGGNGGDGVAVDAMGAGGGGGGAGDANPGGTGVDGQNPCVAGTAGSGGSTGGGNGGAGGACGEANGVAGTAPGGGGGGAEVDDSTNHSGGAGSAGKAIISFEALAGTTGSAPKLDIGRVGQGLEFNGTNSYISVGNAGSVGTIAFWIKVASTTASQKIIDIDGTDMIETNSSSVVTATSFPVGTTVWLDGSTASATLTSGWHHVAITSSGVTASDMDIGRAASSYCGCKIDDVRIYDRALTAYEIKRLYNLGR